MLDQDFRKQDGNAAKTSELTSFCFLTQPPADVYPSTKISFLISPCYFHLFIKIPGCPALKILVQALPGMGLWVSPGGPALKVFWALPGMR